MLVLSLKYTPLPTHKPAHSPLSHALANAQRGIVYHEIEVLLRHAIPLCALACVSTGVCISATKQAFIFSGSLFMYYCFLAINKLNLHIS